MRELFIYYRAQTAQEAHIRRVVESFQSNLCTKFPHLVARLLRRFEESEGQHTWMEIYSANPMLGREGVNIELQAAIEAQASALSAWIVGPRHTEVFISCAS